MVRAVAVACADLETPYGLSDQYFLWVYPLPCTLIFMLSVILTPFLSYDLTF